MRFDWYAATVKTAPHDLLGTLAARLGATVENGNARHGYEVGAVLVKDDSKVAQVLFGGSNGDPHVIASSEDTDRVLPIIRAAWPDAHYVTRMDAAEDYDKGAGTWDDLFATVMGIADGHLRPKADGGPGRPLMISQAGDWMRDPDDPEHGGRTLYVGSPKSSVRVRLYEKGKELNGKALVGQPWSRDLCRVECQVRPEKDSRWTAAVATPEEAFGYAEWTRDLLRELERVEVDRVHIRERRESDLERALFWLATQYGEHLETRASQLGGWEHLGLDLQRRIDAARNGLDPAEGGAE